MSPLTPHARWRETWSLLEGSPTDAYLEELLAHYAERHRAYHNLDHVLTCLSWAASLRAQLTSPGDVEIALWYHDAIYAPRRGDNEERSAALVVEHLAGFPDVWTARIAHLVLLTKHDAEPKDSDGATLIDIDLAILGAEAATFDAYEENIRHEYRWVPSILYRRKRAEILRSFLARPAIYHTEHFRSALEERARANLARSLSQLE
jgi:predicted metal-dependent HD superfamily phosphohydrolase